MADSDRRPEIPLRADGIERPRPDRFGPDHPSFDEAMSAHRKAIERGQPGYMDPQTGLFVMTSTHLRDRAWCCDRGCRHCPYEGGARRSDRPNRATGSEGSRQ